MNFPISSSSSTQVKPKENKAKPPVDPLAEWSSDVKHIQAPPFTREDSGPQNTVPKTEDPELFVALFMPDTMIDRIAAESNKYYERKQRDKGVAEDEIKQLGLDRARLKLFFACIIMLGVYDVPDTDLIWNSKGLGFEWVASRITKHHFDYVLQNLHFVDNDNDDPMCDSGTTDKLWKLRWFLDEVVGSFSKHFIPGRDLSADEHMVASKARIFFRQYMPKKPIKRGFKVWMLCDAETGYCRRKGHYLVDAPQRQCVICGRRPRSKVREMRLANVFDTLSWFSSEKIQFMTDIAHACDEVRKHDANEIKLE